MIFQNYIMPIFVLAVTLGIQIVIFSIKLRWYFRLLFNILVGITILFIFRITNVSMIAFNPINAILIGFLGAPGVALALLLGFIF